MGPADKPEDALIEDDAKLDSWFKTYLRDIQRRSRRKGEGTVKFTENS